MSKPDPRATARNRLRLVAGADPNTAPSRQWYRFANKAEGVTDVYLYGEIGDSWFGDSVSAADFVRELKDVKTERIRLHLHSPGGDAWDGLAILNALRQHPATVTTIIDGVAASAASVVAMGGDEVVMMTNAELMIHDALGLAMGNAALMRDMASSLDRESDNIAAVYAAKAGGDVADWRAAMKAESWYTPAEALEAGLIDRIQEGGDEEPGGEAIVLGGNGVSVEFVDAFPYRYAARAEAPSPPIPSHPDASHATVSDNRDDSGAGEASVDLTELRQALDLGDDVSDDDVIAAAVAKANEAPEDTGDDDKVTVPEGAVVVDATTLDQLKADAAEGRAAAQAIRDQKREAFIASVIGAGKLAPSNAELRADLERAWDESPERAKRLANSLAVVANMAESGHGRNADRPDLDSKWDEWEAAAIPELRTVRANGGNANG